MTITVATDPSLLEHLRKYLHDGATVAELLFEGGRLSYPGRKEIEHQLGSVEPYTLELEARTIRGLDSPTCAAIRLLATAIPVLWTLPPRGTELPDGSTYRTIAPPDTLDPTLELLWMAHSSWEGTRETPSPDRLMAALCAVHELRGCGGPRYLEDAAVMLVTRLHELGLPPTYEGLEEIFDGAWPACVGLGLVEVPG